MVSSSTFTRHIGLLMNEDPHVNVELGKTLQLSEQLEEKLSLFSSTSDEKKVDENRLLSHKVFPKNNIFARRKWTHKAEGTASVIWKDDLIKKDAMTTEKKKKRVPKSNEEKVAEKIASMLGTEELGIISKLEDEMINLFDLIVFNSVVFYYHFLSRNGNSAHRIQRGDENVSIDTQVGRLFSQL